MQGMSRAGATWILFLLIDMISLAILLDVYALEAYHPGKWGVIAASMTLFVTQLWLSASLVAYIIRYLRLRVHPELKQTRVYYTAVSAPYFDPSLGVLMQFAPKSGGASIEVQINPSWASLLPSSLKVNGGDASNETPIVGKFYSSVLPGNEPPSLVAIKSGPQTIGFGCRTKIDGEDCLMTANHVWHSSMRPTALAKAGRQVEVSEWEVPYSSDHKMLDFAVVRVPPEVWSKLGVKSARLVCPSDRDTITCFGGASSDELLSGTGVCSPSEFTWKLTHSCPTAAGWSGAPLYCSRGVIGMHTGFEEIGALNRGVNTFYLANYLLQSQETLPPELSMIEIRFEDVETRSYEFLDAEIKGIGRVKLGKREFAWAPKSGKYWADEDDDELPPAPKLVGGKLVWENSQETVAVPLNCQRAAEPRPLPPSLNLQATTLKKESLPQKEACPSDLLANRLAGLESCVERILQMMCEKPSPASPSLPTSPGPSAVPKPSFTPCYFKQESLIPPGAQGILSELVKHSSRDTQLPGPSRASEAKPGPSTQSLKKSARRRNRAKSTKKQVQGSLSPGSPPPTETS